MIAILSYYDIKDTPYHKWIPERSEDVYLFVNSEVFSSYENSNYNHVISYDNYNNNLNLELDIINIHEKVAKFDSIIALDEFDIDRAGKLREYLNIEGQSEVSSLHFRDKLAMKNAMTKNDIQTTPYSQLNNIFDILNFIKKYDYPVVCKPRRLAGSLGVHIIKNENELKEYLANGINNDYMIEKYVDGEMYHIDGLIIDNKIHFIFPSKYRTDCVDFDNWENGGFTASYMLEKSNPLYNKLCLFTEKAISSLPLPRYSPFHAEVFVTKDNKLLFNEVGSRVPGGRSNYEFYYGTGLNFNEICVRLQSKLPVDISHIEHNITGHIYIPPKKGILKSLPKSLPFDYVLEYCPVNNILGENFTGAKASVDCIATVICKAPNEKEIINNIDEIYNFFNENVIWENE